MSPVEKRKWRIAGEEVASCNCAWGCPCQFNALPTKGRCEALVAWEIRQGHFGETKLDGLRFAQIYQWPGPIHEGNGTRQLIIDSQSTAEQRQALVTLDSGSQGGSYFEIFSTVCPNLLETLTAPIEFKADRERRQASVRILPIAESQVEPIRNPVTGQEHRARIDLPNGFEYKIAEIANAVVLRVTSGRNLVFEHRNTYAHLNAFDWSNY